VAVVAGGVAEVARSKAMREVLELIEATTEKVAIEALMIAIVAVGIAMTSGVLGVVDVVVAAAVAAAVVVVVVGGGDGGDVVAAAAVVAVVVVAVAVAVVGESLESLGLGGRVAKEVAYRGTSRSGTAMKVVGPMTMWSMMMYVVIDVLPFHSLFVQAIGDGGGGGGVVVVVVVAVVVDVVDVVVVVVGNTGAVVGVVACWVMGR
jgi:hypothetical protein